MSCNIIKANHFRISFYYIIELFFLNARSLLETYNTNSQTEFKTSIFKLNLCDYSDMYIVVKVTIIVV